MADPVRDWLDGYLRHSGLMARYPLYASLLGRVDPIDDPGVPVMGVSASGKRFFLHINVDFFVRTAGNLRFLPGVLLHEVHHVVLGHLSLLRLHDAAHSDLMELAMEMSANEHIREPLPGRPVLWQDYARLGIAAGQSTRERYETLVNARRRGEPIPGASELPTILVDSHLPGGVQVGADSCELDPACHHRVRAMVSDLAKDAGADQRVAGRHPGQLLEALEETTAPPRRPMDWRTVLELFAGQLRSPRHTFARPSRRLPSLVGIVPGRVYSPGASNPASLVVAIDTSASMSKKELVEIGRHLRRLSDRLRITVVECDTMIQRVYAFTGRLRDVAGRGGTDLRPVFEPETLRRLRPEGIVYFTDGEGPYPPRDPGVRTLWVLTKGERFACPWGMRTCLGAAREIGAAGDAR